MKGVVPASKRSVSVESRETEVWNLKVVPDAICGCFSYLFDMGAAEKISRQFLQK